MNSLPNCLRSVVALPLLAIVLAPAVASADTEQKHTASIGASLGGYYLRVSGKELEGANSGGLTLLPELRHSYTVSEDWQVYGTLRWTAMSNVTQQKRIEGAATSKTPILFGIGVSRSFRLDDEGGDTLFSLWAPKLSLSVNYGNFKVGSESYVTGIVAMLSVDADFLRVRF